MVVFIWNFVWIWLLYSFSFSYDFQLLRIKIVGWSDSYWFYQLVFVNLWLESSHVYILSRLDVFLLPLICVIYTESDVACVEIAENSFTWFCIYVSWHWCDYKCISCINVNTIAFIVLEGLVYMIKLKCWNSVSL